MCKGFGHEAWDVCLGKAGYAHVGRGGWVREEVSSCAHATNFSCIVAENDDIMTLSARTSRLARDQQLRACAPLSRRAPFVCHEALASRVCAQVVLGGRGEKRLLDFSTFGLLQ